MIPSDFGFTMKFVFSLVKCCYIIISVGFLIPPSQPASLLNQPISCEGDDDLSANPVDCSTYYKCVKGVPVLARCPVRFQFHEEWKTCTWPEQANCTREVTVTDNGSGEQNGNGDDNGNNVTDTGQSGQPFTMIFDKYFPQLKEWEVRISNSSLLNIAGVPQPKAVIEADVLIFRNDTAIYRRKIQIHTAEKLENGTVVAGMLEKYTVSCAILNLKYRMVADFPEPPPWCLPHLVNKVASTNNLRRAYNFLNRVSDYYQH
ncbi:hypothetical protein LSTR_LSTR012233 [Laodelphax striatellus]|uniref:Chitin-binding type-2 domain-containing protein n=1 Tax=Laodelphax striatellus TaxID=195883 RepID=A0A482WTD7_LAOST|nr:hypothetical protein LSTR_LSTR012233 [Laodelphax striatellus]